MRGKLKISKFSELISPTDTLTVYLFYLMIVVFFHVFFSFVFCVARRLKEAVMDPLPQKEEKFSPPQEKEKVSVLYSSS